MPPIWREIQRKNFTDWKKLAVFLDLDQDFFSRILPRSSFPLNLPLRLAQKIAKSSWEDPVLKQFLPTVEENEKSSLFVRDPVADTSARKAPKLLHKYQGRALITCTSACAMHCRYCFRQHFDYATASPTFAEELELIRQDFSIKEVILSGGDPLSLSNAQLRSLFESLDQIPHLNRLRFHTRFPMGIPERIDPEFLDLLASTRLEIFFVIHSNHANEWDVEIFQALKKIHRLGINLLCQSVLLKGINDDADALVALFELLVDNGIIPYYLHQLDRVEGAMHFEVSEEKGHELMHEIGKRLPGYAVPRYVREEAGAASKTILQDRLHALECLNT